MRPLRQLPCIIGTPVHACRNAVIIHEYMFGNELFRIRCSLIALLYRPPRHTCAKGIAAADAQRRHHDDEEMETCKTDCA